MTYKLPCVIINHKGVFYFKGDLIKMSDEEFEKTTNEFHKLKEATRKLRELAKTIEDFGKCDYSEWNY